MNAIGFIHTDAVKIILNGVEYSVTDKAYREQAVVKPIKFSDYVVAGLTGFFMGSASRILLGLVGGLFLAFGALIAFKYGL